MVCGREMDEEQGIAVLRTRNPRRSYALTGTAMALRFALARLLTIEA